jgi:hypothetical protein
MNYYIIVCIHDQKESIIIYSERSDGIINELNSLFSSATAESESGCAAAKCRQTDGRRGEGKAGNGRRAK